MASKDGSKKRDLEDKSLQGSKRIAHFDEDEPMMDKSGKPMTKADKRAHHNALERKRRDHIKDSFSVLRDSIPQLSGEKASRAQILNKATDYIQYMRKKNAAHQSEMEELRRQNAQLGGDTRDDEKPGEGI